MRQKYLLYTSSVVHGFNKTLSNYIWEHSTNNCCCKHKYSWNQFCFYLQKNRISNLLEEVGLSNSNSKIYSPVTYFIVKIQENINCCQKLDLNLAGLDKSLPIMYWLPKMHKIPIAARYTAASKTTAQSHSLIQYPKSSK